jgi:uncharacterized membrane protein (DUF2068 family)
MTNNYFLPLKSQSQHQQRPASRWMKVIAAGRFVYGAVLLAAGLTIFNLIGKNLAVEILNLIKACHLDTHVYYVHWLLQKVGSISHGLLVLLAVANFFYAALAFTEGTGLLFGKRWAYWLVIADTASFIPVEIYQLCVAFGWINLGLLMFYIVSVVYLLRQIGRKPELGSALILSPTLKLGFATKNRTPV